MSPQVLQDATTGVPYYIDPNTGKRYDAVNGVWQEYVAPPVAPAPPAPPAPVAPVIPGYTVGYTVGMTPSLAPMAAPFAQPGTMPFATVAAPSAVEGLQALMGAAGGPSTLPNGFLNFDMGDVSDNAYRTIPQGTNVESLIKEIEVVPVKSNPNNNQLKLTLSVVFPPNYKGVTMYEYVQLDETGRWKFKRLCRVTDNLDPTGARFTGTSHLAFKNEVIRYTVKNEEYNQQMTNKVGSTYEVAYETPGIYQKLSPTLQAMVQQTLAAPTVAATPAAAPAPSFGAAPVFGQPSPPVTPQPVQYGVPAQPAQYGVPAQPAQYGVPSMPQPAASGAPGMPAINWPAPPPA